MARSGPSSRLFLPARDRADWDGLLAHEGERRDAAQALATTWQRARGFPKAVEAAFEGSGRLFEEIELLLALPQLRTPLPPARSRASQTDLFVLARTGRVLVALSVEAKMAEPFGPTVGDWLGPSPSEVKQQRLSFLSQILQLPVEDALDCPYELLHRTAAALVEARGFTAQHAVVLVHSFDPRGAGFDQFARFASRLGTQARVGGLAPTTPREGTLLHLGWVAGTPPRGNARPGGR